MAYSLKIVHKKFNQEVDELNAIVKSLSIEEQGLVRDTHVEGCFIRLVVCWECFIEEYFLRCMCSAERRTANSHIKPHGVTFRKTEEAFKKINKNRRNRSQDFIDWLDSNLIKQRANDYFRKNSRVHKIYESPDRLFELKVIRNAIAHRSTSAILKFEKYVKSQLGYLAALDPTMATLLVQKKRNTDDIIFTIISNYFKGLADRLTK